MTVQCRFFSIPVCYESGAETELNDFLRTVRLITIHRELICQEGRYYWIVAVEYSADGYKSARETATTRKRIDYKEVLSPENFAVFSKLREWRKEAAAKESIQLYAVFTNDQLAAMVEKKITTKAGLKEVDGVGDARVEKYGAEVLGILRKAFGESKNEPSK